MTGDSVGFVQVLSEIFMPIIDIILLLVLWNIFVPVFPHNHNKIRIREHMVETVFSCLLYLNLKHLSYFAVYSLTVPISDHVTDNLTARNDIEAFVARYVDVLYVLTGVLYFAVIALLIIPVGKIVRKRIKMSMWEFAFLSVLNVAGIVLTKIMVRLAIVKTDDGAFILTDEKPELLWQLPLVALLLYIGELSAIYIWQRYDVYREQGQLYYAENLEKEAIKKRLKETEDYYDRVRSVRHEMSNHLMTIRGLANGGHNRELSDYIAKIENEMEPVSLPFSTGNPVTDVVLGDKYRIAKEADIACRFSFNYDDEWQIPVYDISIVLDNILDNAIEAASDAEKRYIELDLIEREKIILIRCENSRTQKTEGDRGKDTYWHGIGLKNVNKIASRYDGAVDIGGDDNRFVISVMMKKIPFATEN